MQQSTAKSAKLDGNWKTGTFVCRECGAAHVWDADQALRAYQDSERMPCGHCWESLRVQAFTLEEVFQSSNAERAQHMRELETILEVQRVSETSYVLSDDGFQMGFYTACEDVPQASEPIWLQVEVDDMALILEEKLAQLGQ